MTGLFILHFAQNSGFSYFWRFFGQIIFFVKLRSSSKKRSDLLNKDMQKLRFPAFHKLPLAKKVDQKAYAVYVLVIVNGGLRRTFRILHCRVMDGILARSPHL